MSLAPAESPDPVTLRLPRKHASDWLDRLGGDMGAELVAESERTVTLSLSRAQLTGLVADAQYYEENMKGDWTLGADLASAAHRCLNAIRRQMPDVNSSK